MDSSRDHRPAQEAQRPAPPAGGSATLRLPGGPSLDSQTLLQGGRAVSIRHNGEVYRLQATRQGKLILTK
ncbi:MAG: hemin uptake protein HemP [Hylemonella sp.]|uniref:hemin uptake protein HemP n=1 Tax=Hylemonella sp. TaxID=2066020 RepID=UPI0022C9A410|nr:hemin uptake protein HemP [Hylemonella sp.]MCZ8251796.1 hemin uptake protein HemP [Hylemonella sp.]